MRHLGSSLVYFCVFLKKQTFTTEITAIYKLQQQTQLSTLNTLLCSAPTQHSTINTSCSPLH